MKSILVTGSSGLIGSEICLHFADQGWKIHGIDNNQRAVFFGESGDTRWNQTRIQDAIQCFEHHVEENRIGDHICYYSDLTKMKEHYPDWNIRISLEETIGQIVAAWQGKLK